MGEGRQRSDFGEVEPGETVVTLEFHERGKQTEVVLTHENFASAEVAIVTSTAGTVALTVW